MSRNGTPSGSLPGNPADYPVRSPDLSLARQTAPPSHFEQPTPEEDPNFTEVSDTPFPPRPLRVFGGGSSTASGSPSGSASRVPSPTMSPIQQRLDAMRLEERQLKDSIDNERERAHREYLIHQKEVQALQVDIQHLAMRKREAEIAVARILIYCQFLFKQNLNKF